MKYALSKKIETERAAMQDLKGYVEYSDYPTAAVYCLNGKVCHRCPVESRCRPSVIAGCSYTLVAYGSSQEDG